MAAVGDSGSRSSPSRLREDLLDQLRDSVRRYAPLLSFVMNFDSFVPRSTSKVVFAIVITCYSMDSDVANAPGRLFIHQTAANWARHPHCSPWAMHFSEGLVLAPVLESLVLIGMIESLRVLKSPRSVQIILSALAMGLLHSFSWHPELSSQPQPLEFGRRHTYLSRTARAECCQLIVS